jgi:phosphatidylglycerophosphate synthase
VTVSVRAGTALPGYGPTAGMAVQFALLAGLAAGVGLGSAGWLTAMAYALVTWAVLTRALYRSGMRSLGPANRVTLARATLVGCVTAIVADSAGARTPVVILVALASVALILDAVDGRVARRTGTTSPLGARFDMEIDSVLVLVLSVYVARSLGLWVLAIGLFRYAFVAAALVLPWLRAPLPPRFSRKTVAAMQGVVLVVASAGLVPRPLMIAVVGASLAVLVWSFARDIGWLWRVRDVPPSGDYLGRRGDQHNSSRVGPSTRTESPTLEELC